MRATRLLAALSFHLNEVGAVLEPDERYLYAETAKTVRAALGAPDFESVWQAGHALTIAQAFNEALA